jgi:virginiamycin B lyase
VALLLAVLGASGCNLSFGATPHVTVTSAPTLSKITEFQFPARKAFARAITTGGDGNMWFGLTATSGGPDHIAPQIGRITPNGTITEFPLPARDAAIPSVAKGPDGNIWYLRTSSSGPARAVPSAVGRVTPTGVVTEFSYNGFGSSLTPGRDGALWFTEVNEAETRGFIGRITVEGKITEYPITPAGALPQAIVSGSDGALWFGTVASQSGAASIVRMTTQGAMKIFPLPAKAAAPSSLVFGPDGALWFVEPPVNLEKGPHLGHMLVTGEYKQYPLKVGGNVLAGLAVGPDNAIWVAGPGALERFTVLGAETNVALPNPNDVAVAITAGPHGFLWFSEIPVDANAAGKIARLS